MAEIKPVIEKKNLIILIISAILVILGFILMAGGGSEDPNVFSEAIFSARRLIIAPLLVVGGFSLAIYGIMKK